MFLRKKKSEPGNLQQSVRRRFHHILLSQRKAKLPTHLPKSPLTKIHRAWHRTHGPHSFLLRRLILLAVVAGIILGGLYVVFFSKFFIISKVQLEKDGEAVMTVALTPFLDKLRGQNILFARIDALAHDIERSFKNEVLLATVKKSYPNKVVVKIEEYPSVLNVNVHTPEKSHHFVINQIGYTIALQGEDKKVPTLSMSLPKLPIGKFVLIPPEKLHPMVQAYQKFTELFGIKIVEGVWKNVERELHLTTEKKFVVWIDLTEDVDRQLIKLKRALPKLDIYRESLEYIDLRIAAGESEKVIFKRRR